MMLTETKNIVMNGEKGNFLLTKLFPDRRHNTNFTMLEQPRKISVEMLTMRIFRFLFRTSKQRVLLLYLVLGGGATGIVHDSS